MTNTSKEKTSHALYVLGSIYPQVTGGMEIFNYYFLRYQLNHLHKKDFYLTTQTLDDFKESHIRLIRIRPITVTYPLQLFWVLLRYRKRISYIYSGYARQPWVIPYFNALLFRLFRKPYIITIHSGGKPQWKLPAAYKYYFTHAYKLIGVSEAICEDYGSLLGNKKIEFIPPLIPFETSSKTKTELKTELGIPSSTKVLLYVGTLKAMKNPDKVLKAFELFKNKMPGADPLRLVFVGGGEMLEELKSYTASKGLTGYVSFTGLIKREIIPAYFGMADFYIISSDYEGTSISLLEAMFNKLPIISADSPGLNRMLQANRNALLYPAHDIEQLAGCIASFISNPQLADTLAYQAYRDYQEGYSYESMIKRYEDIFSKLDGSGKDY